MAKTKLIRFVIGFQGFYYLITGIWATFFLSNFEGMTRIFHQGLDFGMHILAGGMFIVLGSYYIYSIKKKDWFKTHKDLSYLVIGIALSIIIVELIYLPRMGGGLFWIDLIEEMIIVILLVFGVNNKKV